MPVGIAVGTAAATVGAAAIGASGQKKAAKQAANAQQDATAQQLQLGRESLGLSRDIYNANFDTLSPFVSNGMTASNAMTALLGLPAGQPMQSPLAQQPQQQGGNALGGFVGARSFSPNAFGGGHAFMSHS